MYNFLKTKTEKKRPAVVEICYKFESYANAILDLKCNIKKNIATCTVKFFYNVKNIFIASVRKLSPFLVKYMILHKSLMNMNII